MTPFQLAADHVSVRFGDTQALSDVTFSCGPGEFIGITGKNGSGKTTLMRVLSGQCRPQKGTVCFSGTPVYGRGNTPYKRCIGFVHEDPFLYPYLSVENMARFVTRIKLEHSGGEFDETDRILDIVAMHDHRSTIISDLSMGMKRRLALGLALIGRPRIIFLDEPFVNIDFENMHSIKTALAAFVQKGGCILLSTHILDTAERLCSRILLLKEGESVCDIRGKALHKQLQAAGGHLEEFLIAMENRGPDRLDIPE